MRNRIVYLFLILACCIMACKEKAKNTEDIICGGSFRYWYVKEAPNYYHYFDINGRKESFYITKNGMFKEDKMPDFEMSTTWKLLNDSTIIMYYDREYSVKVIDDETIIIFDDTLHVLKDYKYIPKEYQKILGKDIKTGASRSRDEGRSGLSNPFQEKRNRK